MLKRRDVFQRIAIYRNQICPCTGFKAPNFARPSEQIGGIHRRSRRGRAMPVAAPRAGAALGRPGRGDAGVRRRRSRAGTRGVRGDRSLMKFQFARPGTTIRLSTESIVHAERTSTRSTPAPPTTPPSSPRPPIADSSWIPCQPGFSAHFQQTRPSPGHRYSQRHSRAGWPQIVQ